MKIAIVAEHINQHGGQARVLAELATRLATRHQVDLFCFSAADIPLGRVRVHRLWCPFKSSTLQAIWLVVLSVFVIRLSRYDVVLSQGGNSLVQNFVLVHTCHAQRARALREVRWQYERPTWWVRLGLTVRQAWATWMEGRAVRKCRGRVLAVSQMVVRYLAAEHGIALDEAYATPNGLDHHIFNPEARAALRAEGRALLGASPDQFLIVFAGGGWFDKGLPLVIEALALMKQPATLMVVGEYDQEPFRALAEENSVAERVIFTGPTDEIVRYYAAADCLVMPARGEGFGLVVAEAAACGVPLVTSDIGAADELVEDAVSGFRVDYDSAQIADRLDRLAKDPALCERMGQAAHHKALTLSWDRQAQEIEQFLISHLPEPATDTADVLLPPLRGDRPGPLRVAVISHSCVVDVNQEPYVKLLDHGDIELRLFSPQRWWAAVSGPVEFSALAGMGERAIALPVWAPGQIHLHWYTRELARELDAFRPDILFIDEEPYSLPAAQGMYLAKSAGYRVVGSTKQNLARRLPLPFEWIYSSVIAGSDHVVVVSDQCEEILRDRGYAGPSTVLAHGVAPSVLEPSAASERPATLPRSGALVGYAGRLAVQKGILDLIAAAELAAGDGGPEFSLVLIGDGPLRSRVEEIARSSGNKPRIEVLGHVPHSQVNAYIGALDVLVLPSHTTARWREQFGRVIIEALACGVPVIGSDSGHIPHLIADTGGGLIFPEGDVEQLAEHINYVISNPGRARELGQEGRARVLEKYTWEQTARKLREVFLQVGSQP